MTSKLPPPKVHFDFLRTAPNMDMVRQILAFPPERKLAIIRDETGEECGMANMAEFFGTTYTMTRAMLLYELHHQQVICVGPRMQAAFANTSLANVPLDMVRLPYPCFYLATPESEDLVLWGGTRTGWHRVVGMYVVMETHRDVSALSVLAWAEANEKSIVPTDDATFWFRIDLDHHSETTFEQSFEKSLDPKYVRQTITTIESESAAVANELEAVHAADPDALRRINLDKALDKLLANRASEASDIGMGLDNSPRDRIERVRQTARKLMRIAVNTVLYMNSTGADLSDPETTESERARLRKKIAGFKNPNKKDARLAKRKLDDLTKCRLVWVGPTIEQEVGGEHDLTESSGRTVSGHVRRGHWHTFLVGPRKREGEVIVASERGRTLKWIPPLWVGGAKEPTERRVYAVRE